MIHQLIQKSSDLEILKEKWADLLNHSVCPSLAQSWEWMKTWWDIYGQERDLFLFCGYKDGQLIGIAPLAIGRQPTSYFKSLKFKTVWFLGSGRTRVRGVLSEYLDFIIKQGFEEDFVNTFIRYMSNDMNWDEMILENISVESPLPKLLKRNAEAFGLCFNILRTTPSILIKLPESWDDYLKSISSSLRYKIRRGRNEFSKLGGTYHLVKSLSELPRAFSDLERLHQLRWARKGKNGVFSNQEWKTFHKNLMPLLLTKNHLKLSFLRIADQPVAANYNFAFYNKVHFFQSGMRSDSNKHLRLGLILHSYCIEEAINEGYEEYDFLQIGASGPGYKVMWGNRSRDLLTIRIARRSNKERIYNCLSQGFIYARKVKAGILGARFYGNSEKDKKLGIINLSIG